MPDLVPWQDASTAKEVHTSAIWAFEQQSSTTSRPKTGWAES